MSVGFEVLLQIEESAPTADRCSGGFGIRGHVSPPQFGKNADPWIFESLDEQLNQLAAELIAGDPDDPPLSQGAIAEMLNNAEHLNGITRSTAPPVKGSLEQQGSLQSGDGVREI